MAIQFTGGTVKINANFYALYDFSSFTFTSATVSGQTPPTLQLLKAVYTSSASGSVFAGNSQYFTTGSYQGYQIWTVPATATYEIEAAGARSGIATYPTVTPKTYWGGAIIKGRYNLTQGQKVIMVVGQIGLTPTGTANSYNGPGGGGGTYFVLSGSNTPIIVAGGAGAGGAYSSDSSGAGIMRSGSNGATTTSGSSSWGGAPGGTGSLGGMSHKNAAGSTSLNSYDGGGGGGFSGSGYNGNAIVGAAGTTYGGGGLSFLNGATGGAGATSYTPTQAQHGGFGGGGGGTPIAGGAGGGYAGGGGGYRPGSTQSDGGGGGGSFVASAITYLATSNGLYENLSTFSGSAITNLNAYNSGSGYIKITKL